MSRRIWPLLLLFVASFATAEMEVYVVHMDRQKMKDLDASLTTSKRWYEAVIDSITELAVPGGEEEKESEESAPRLLYVYETAMSGFSAQLSKKQLDNLKQVDGFLCANRDEILSLHTTHSPHFLGLKRGRGLWSAPSLASDVIVGIVDTGIWPEHKSFRDSGMSRIPSQWKGKCETGTNFTAANCNKKIIGARVFFKAYEALIGTINEAIDYRSPRDSQGHGTHTSSTAAGNVVKPADFLGLARGAASGIRYTSRIAVYKACYSLGCTSSDVLAAINQAVLDGVHVISLSLGGFPRPYDTDNIAIAAFGAIMNGVSVSASAGNSGPISSTVGNTAPWIMTVGASYTDRSFPCILKLGNRQTFIGASLYYGKPTKQLPLVYGATAGGKGAEFCINGSLSSELVKGKIVVCNRGINGRTEKGEQVKIAGGSGMIIVNSKTQGEELVADAHILPAIMVGAQAAVSIKNYMNSTKVATASIAFLGTDFHNPAPVMAAFSSRGPSAIGPDVIKPDVTAPGVNILAAWPPTVSPSTLKSDKRSVKFNIVSGTSMSCPHVTGIVALIKSVHKDWSPAAIKSALMTTAYTLDNSKAPISDAANGTTFATPFAFGSGHVDPEKAADPGLVYDISVNNYLDYLCSLNYNASQMALFAKGSYTCPGKSVPHPGDLNYPSFAVMMSITSRNLSLTYKRTVTNVGIPNSVYGVHVIKPKGVLVNVQPKVLHFQMVGEKKSYEVSFSSITPDDKASFGAIVWTSKKYKVRSPIAVTWQ